jgi:hypothetical protein
MTRRSPAYLEKKEEEEKWIRLLHEQLQELQTSHMLDIFYDRCLLQTSYV